MNKTRFETDAIGEMQVPTDALYGIHATRARENFPHGSRFSEAWYRSIGLVKQACYITFKKYIEAAHHKYPEKSLRQSISPDHLQVLTEAAYEVSQGQYFNHFIVPAVCGGAGTSINLNVNEIITNVSLIKLGGNPGDYHIIHPIEHANIYQSTNDVIPTSLHIAAMQLLTQLENAINSLRYELEQLEKTHHASMRIGYTQMQEAVPTSFGRLFSTYNDALSRDWWRISKCAERMKSVNMGGSAIGTGLTVPRYFIYEVIKQLQHLSALPISRAENLSDATCNQDELVETHGIIKTHAVNLEKMSGDLRLLSSDMNSTKQISIPAQQTGSSIMPGKINPVIPEFVISACHKVYANDQLITGLSAQGCLELNAYLPIIGDTLLDSLQLLTAANQSIQNKLIRGLVVHTEQSLQKLLTSPSITTALLPFIGYEKASELAHYMKSNTCTIYEANKRLKFIDEQKIKELLHPEKLLQEGFTLKDLD
ncbi:MAG: aspartate ammonia-lyase [Bacteroidetes bacterium]|jgi:aspartate ammonia-lyase|nr:aspartate ammonia-lyase [Bacteroidota bacterium]